ncbi:hypothetical protein OPV22_012550 [Ensete ventricosum]|uniref:Uncharacterized protein n=1 Tax=Ensete ventricosum TaxID=4639 RepID=A0AAV8QYW2_ENSVE|nr:hypothetical protein OPV22_012550 [Ensete ventricosum]
MLNNNREGEVFFGEGGGDGIVKRAELRPDPEPSPLAALGFRSSSFLGIADGSGECTNLQLGHEGDDSQSMTRRWQLMQTTATMLPHELDM